MTEPAPAPASRPPTTAESFDSVMPIVLFLVLNKTLGLGWAIGGATAWSVKAAVSRRRRGLPIGRLLPLITAFIVARGVVGILTDSEAVYFGIGIGTKYAIGLGLIASVVVGRDVVGWAAPYLFGFDAETQRHPIYRRTTRIITLAIAVYELLSATFDIWLFNNASTNEYVFIRFVISWPLGMMLFLGSLAFAARRFAAIPGFPGVLALLEAQAGAQKAGDAPDAG